MRLPAIASVEGLDRRLDAEPSPLVLDKLVPGDGPWEVEIGFGKGRFLLAEAIAQPERRFFGIEVVSKYQRLLAQRAARQGVSNLAAVRGEALYLLTTILPPAFAETVHVYFPDPWPKARHHRRRLFDAESVDLVLSALRPGGRLCFASDFLDYAEQVVDLLSGMPGLTITRLEAPWPGGARTNYEAKYMREGRPIVRLIAQLDDQPPVPLLHPDGVAGIVAATSSRPTD